MTFPATASRIEPGHLARCSTELTEMTRAVAAWGRARWPGARVIYEHRVGGCRIDVMFALPDHLVGVEIKSSRDTFDRLAEQMRQFSHEIPELWLAVAPKWLEKATDPNDDRVPWSVGRLVVANGIASESVRGLYGQAPSYPHPARPDVMLTAPMLHLLYRNEAHDLARRYGIKAPATMPLYKLVPLLARKLTGDQIVAEVCGALRSRPVAGWASDALPAEPAAQEGQTLIARAEGGEHGQ